jgi:hypothetical protein
LPASTAEPRRTSSPFLSIWDFWTRRRSSRVLPRKWEILLPFFFSLFFSWSLIW